MTSPASGTHTRIQMRRDGQAIVPHGTLQTYDPETGAFTAFMDFQEQGLPAYQFTPSKSDILALNGEYTDQNGLVWKLIR